MIFKVGTIHLTGENGNEIKEDATIIIEQPYRIKIVSSDGFEVYSIDPEDFKVLIGAYRQEYE